MNPLCGNRPMPSYLLLSCLLFLKSLKSLLTVDFDKLSHRASIPRYLGTTGLLDMLSSWKFSVPEPVEGTTLFDLILLFISLASTSSATGLRSRGTSGPPGFVLSPAVLFLASLKSLNSLKSLQSYPSASSAFNTSTPMTKIKI